MTVFGYNPLSFLQKRTFVCRLPELLKVPINRRFWGIYSIFLLFFAHAAYRRRGRPTAAVSGRAIELHQLSSMMDDTQWVGWCSGGVWCGRERYCSGAVSSYVWLNICSWLLECVMIFTNKGNDESYRTNYVRNANENHPSVLWIFFFSIGWKGARDMASQSQDINMSQIFI